MDATLEAASWDLEPLVGGRGADGVADAMHELAAIHDLDGRAGSYAALSFSLDTTDPERGALMQRARELSAAIETALVFFELEWNQVPDERAEELLASPELDFCRHHLLTLRRYRPHQLSEPEERILTETRVTGPSAFQRLFTEQTSVIEISVPSSDEPVSLEEALSRLQQPDRERRAEAAAGLTEALRDGLRTRAFVFNTLLQDKATKDRLRSYPHWLASRNLANEASDESVEALIEAVKSRYELPPRWYRLKASLLGLDPLAHWDRVAPGTATSAHPYVLLNYTSRPQDVLVMAHEIGHGVHASLARPQGIFHFTTPLTLAETASIFGETIVLERLLERAPGPAERLNLLAGSLDGAVAAVFRQVAMNRFEDAIHTERR